MTDPSLNRLLAALPKANLKRFTPHLQLVDLPLGVVLQASGSALEYVYFPTTAVVSLLSPMEDGNSAEIAIVGNDGVVGIAIFMGGESTLARAVVQCAGQAFRMKASTIKTEFKRPQVMFSFLRYTQALITQMSQTAVCNRHHAVDQQLCRWLLLSLDRLPGDQLLMTQDLIADLLGVSRGGVSEAAKKLQDANVIRYSRGLIKVLDRPALEQRSCECYAVVKAEYGRLLSP